MGKVNYELLVSQLIQPLATHPEVVNVKIIAEEGNLIRIQAQVHPDDLGRVIGKKGRVANAIRTLVYVAATREKKQVEIDLMANEQ